MTINSLLFYAVYLSQVLLISLYLPNRLLHRARHVIETFPPSEYPRLYPEPLARINRKLRIYRYLNGGLLLLGLGLLAAAWLSDYRIAARYGAYPTAVAYSSYTILQLSPIIVLSFWGIAYFRRLREAARGRIRTAELKARRPFEFVSPPLLGTAVAMYVVASAVLLYVDGGPGWLVGGFPGWLSFHRHGVKIATMTIFNALGAGIIVWSLYGKKQHPHQTHEDRAMQIRLVSRSVLVVSTLLSAFTAGGHLLDSFELWHYGPLLSSLFTQVTCVITLASALLVRVDRGSFDVYKANPNRGTALATNN
jgi:hypothetical protein